MDEQKPQSRKASRSYNACSYARWLGKRAGRVPKSVIQVGVGAGVEASVFRKLWPDSVIVGCDPHPLVDAASYPGEVIRAAVGQQRGLCQFFDSYGFWDRSGTVRPRHDATSYWVSVITVDFVVAKFSIQAPLVMWLDCEGSEYAALRGARSALRMTDWLVIEMNKTRSWRTRRLLQRHGFEQVFEKGCDSIWQRTHDDS